MEVYLMTEALEDDKGMTLLKDFKFAEAKIFYVQKLREVTVKLGNDHPEYLNVIEKAGLTLLKMGNVWKAKKLFEEVVSKRRTCLGESHPDCIRVYLVLSLITNRLYNKSEADLLYDRLRNIHDNIDRQSVEFVRCCFQIAIAYLNVYKTEQAERLLEELLEKQLKSNKKDDLTILIKYQIGRTHMKAKRYSEAIAYFENILKTNSDFFKENPNWDCLCKIHIGTVYCLMGKFSEAQLQLEGILKEYVGKICSYDKESNGFLCLIALCNFRQFKLEEAKGYLEEARKNMAEIYGKESIFYLDLSVKIAKTLITMRKFAEAKNLLDELLREVKFFVNGDALYLNVLALTSHLNIEMGKHEEGIVILKKVLLKQIDVIGEYHPAYLESKMILARVYLKSYKYKESLQAFEDILKLQSSNFEANKEECVHTKLFIAMVHMKLKKFDDSVTVLQEVLHSKVLGEEHKNTIIAMGLLGVSKFGLGERDEGISLVDSFLKKIKFSLKDFDIFLFICFFFVELKEYETSKRISECILKPLIENLGEDHPHTVEIQLNVARCLRHSGKLLDAKMMFYKALEKLSKLCAIDHRLALEAKTEIVMIMKGLGKHKEAINLLNELLKIYEKDEVYNLQIIETMIMIAYSQLELGKNTESKCMAEIAFTRLSKINNMDDPLFIQVAVELAALSYAVHDYAKSINICKKILSIPHNIFGVKHPKYNRLMEVLCHSLICLRNFAEARQVVLDLLIRMKDTYGEEHPEFLSIRSLFLCFI